MPIRMIIQIEKRGDFGLSGFNAGLHHALITFSAHILIRFEGCGVYFVIKYFDVDGI